MSKRGATHRGSYRPRFDQKLRSRAGQRNRRADKGGGKLADISYEQFRKMVEKCRSKVAHKSPGAAWAAKQASEREFGKKFYIYECPICGKWHLTTHPWRKENR